MICSAFYQKFSGKYSFLWEIKRTKTTLKKQFSWFNAKEELLKSGKNNTRAFSTASDIPEISVMRSMRSLRSPGKNDCIRFDILSNFSVSLPSSWRLSMDGDRIFTLK